MAARDWGSAPEVTTLKDLWFGAFAMLPATPVKSGSFLFNDGANGFWLVVTEGSTDPNPPTKYRIQSSAVASFCGFLNGTWYTTGAGNGPNGSTIPAGWFGSLSSGNPIPYTSTWSGFD
jgi:hypothetical protein